jgi:hypothetical protein
MSFVANMLLGTLPTVTPPKPAPRERTKSVGHKATVKALARYRAVMGNEWVKSMEIMRRLGTHSGSLQRTLNKWYRAGLIERRKADKGYEWRMK